MSFKRRLFLCSALLITTGCAKYFYNPATPSALPSYIRKLAVRPFANHTQQYGLEDKLTLAVQSEFNRDGRYQITSEEQADGIVIGDITKYVLEPLSYDVNHVPTEYKLWILVDVSFKDKVKDQTLWKEPAMDGELRYFVSSSGFAGSLTEDEARQTIYDELARDISTRVYQGSSTISGADKNTRNTTPEKYNANSSDNNPPPVPPEEPEAPSPTRQPY